MFNLEMQGVYDGDHGSLPQDGPLWHEDYDGLKSIKTQQIQEKPFTLP